MTLVAAAFGIAVLGARGASGRSIGFDEARCAAVARGPDTVLARARVGAARAEIDVARAWENPTLGVSTATQTARLGTSLSVPLPIFGQRGTAVAAARANAETAALEVPVAAAEARWAATLAWIDLWASEERARLFDVAARDAERLLSAAKEKFDAGSASRVDVVRTGASRATARAESAAARRDVAAASARLAPLVGEEPTDALETSGDPNYPSTPLDRPALGAVVEGHPLLRRDGADIAARAAEVRNQERNRWPIVTADVALNQFDPTIPGPDLIVGLSFQVPVFNQRGGEIERARAEEKMARFARGLDARRLGSDFLDAYRRTEGADEKLAALRKDVLPAMQEAEAMTEDGYREGRLDLTRVLEAQKALLDARMNEVETVTLRARAFADLERAAGVDLGGGRRAP